ncbi:teratocarcinoma-derived growth factor-like [Mercenaria mercenaria]|uniref:teratocarcinoma-derived growth factor-like n=1 Tax=Mercenaria mercenaria TaxID=6596 RepID=UPI00234E4742|nr:teratocarcinoma-derived growth factor-like [Mercenaria mercenaria]
MELLNLNIITCTFCVFRSVLCVLLVAVVVTLDASQEESDWLARSLRAASREKRTHNKDRRHKIDAGKNSLIATDEQESCCFNGGICIMNSFCHCKKNFYGRYCEHRVRHRSCGTIRHGTWMAAGCHLCHCFDGEMTCKVTTIRGCDKLSYVEGYEKDPDYMVGMDKKVEDYDKFYDEYDYSPETEVQMSGIAKLEASAWLVITVVITKVVLRNFDS